MLLKVAVKRYDLAKNSNTKEIKMRKKIAFERTEFHISSAFLFYIAFMSSVLRSLVLYMFKVSEHALHVLVLYVPSYPPCPMYRTCFVPYVS